MAQTIDVTERQRIVRLLVKEVLVNDDTITIRHSIPITNKPPADTGPSSASAGAQRTSSHGSYLLRTGSKRPSSGSDQLSDYNRMDVLPPFARSGRA